MGATHGAGGDVGVKPASAPLAVDELYPAHAVGVTTRFVEVRDGLRMRVLESGPAAGRPVVLLHGWGASAYSYRDAIPALSRAGYRTIAVDLPGHGLSDKPAALAWYSRAGMTATAGALLDSLDVRAATVVGVSMGGGIATGLAVERHPRLAGVALVNPVGFAPVRFTTLAQMLTPLVARDYASYLVARPLVSWFLHLAYWDQSRVTERDVDEYWSTASQPGCAAALVACLHEFSWDPFPPSALARVEVPMLLVLGVRDHLIVGSEAGTAAIAGVRVVRIAGGHAVNEECPDDVNAALLAFMHE